MAPRILIGLGNPDKEYAETRHNLGFMVVERVAKALKVKLRIAGRMRLGPVRRGGFSALLVQPLTYMNLSGIAARQVLDQYGAEPEAMMVVVDDVNLQVGQVRIRTKGSDGGHNGLKSIISELGTISFPRIRVGIGQPSREVEVDTRDHVLGPFREEELESIEAGLDQAAEAAQCWIREGSIQKIMTKYNRKPAGAPEDPDRSPGSTDGES